MATFINFMVKELIFLFVNALNSFPLITYYVKFFNC